MKNTEQIINKVNKENVNKDLNLFAMSKQNLIKKVQILMHELTIHNVYKQSKQNLQKISIQAIHKDLIQRSLIIDQLKKNQSTYQHTFKIKQKRINTLEMELTNKEAVVDNLRKQNELLKKKIASNEKSKDKENQQRIQMISKQARQRLEILQEQNKKLKKIQKELNNKVKILNDLNQQTQQKFANALIETRKIPKEEVKNNKQNIDTNKAEGNFKLQNLSLRQTIRALRQQLRLSEESKQLLKSKFHQKQLFYSRMVGLRQ